jgi:hypothetical protein
LVFGNPPTFAKIKQTDLKNTSILTNFCWDVIVMCIKNNCDCCCPTQVPHEAQQTCLYTSPKLDNLPFQLSSLLCFGNIPMALSSREKQLMTLMMREERCANNGLLLEGKKNKPLNHLQRLGFDCFEEAKALNNYNNYFCFKTFFFFFCYNL